MRLATLALCFSLLPVLVSARSASGPDELQGTWQLQSGSRDGVAFTDQTLRATTIEFKDHTFRFPNDTRIGTAANGTYTIDTSVTPHTMDSVSADGTLWLGIYKIEADVYTVVFSKPGAARPTQFTSTADNGQLLQVWKRGAQNAQDNTFENFEGEWTGDVVAHFVDGSRPGTQILRITEQNGELVRGEHTWKQIGGSAVGTVGNGGAVTTATEPLLGVVDFDGKTLHLVEQGDGGMITVRLRDADTMEMIYLEPGDVPTVFRQTLTRKAR